MTAHATMTLKHEDDDGTVVFLGAVSVQHISRGTYPVLKIEVPGDDPRRECYGGRAYLMNAQGKTIEVFNLSAAAPSHPHPGNAPGL